MKKESLLVLLSLVILLAFAATLALPGYSQSPSPLAHTGSAAPASPSNTSTVATDKSENSVAAASTAATAPYAAAARRNLELRTSLDWAFGGRQQRGWSLYEPLISHTLNSEHGGHSGDFALALARWQQGAGLASTGVLDRDTLMQLVNAWQSRRLKDRTYPTPDQLVTAPASDFYDPARPAELRQVRRDAYAAYQRMLAAALADPTLKLARTPDGRLAPEEKFLKIVSAFRSREYQDRLRKLEPGAGRAALAVNSPHFTGCALDLYVGGEPVITKDANRALQVQTPAYKWLVKNAERFGFYPYYYEPWHWEYAGGATIETK